MHQCHDCNVVSFAESHLIRQRNSDVESLFARQGRSFFFASVSPASKSVKGSHGGVLVAPRYSLQLGAMFADVENSKLERKGHDRVACVVKAVKVSCLCVTAYMKSNADVRCPENVTKLRKISNPLLKQGCEFVTAADWKKVPEQLETTGVV